MGSFSFEQEVDVSSEEAVTFLLAFDDDPSQGPPGTRAMKFIWDMLSDSRLPSNIALELKKRLDAMLREAGFLDDAGELIRMVVG